MSPVVIAAIECVVTCVFMCHDIYIPESSFPCGGERLLAISLVIHTCHVTCE